MKNTIYAAFAALSMWAVPVAAQDNPVVVELYTSQGCSSCPPADKILHELAKRDDVIALALHVDYWDYIGWKDPFGNPAHADRQRSYAAAAGRRTIYTPEIIVQGETEIVGAKAMKISKAISDHARVPAQVSLSLTRSGDAVQITAQALAQIEGPFTIHMLHYAPLHTTQIKRGENRGKTLEYANVVEGWTELGSWDGREALDMTAQVEGDKPTVVIIQKPEGGPILAAARVK